MKHGYWFQLLGGETFRSQPLLTQAKRRRNDRANRKSDRTFDFEAIVKINHPYPEPVLHFRASVAVESYLNLVDPTVLLRRAAKELITERMRSSKKRKSSSRRGVKTGCSGRVSTSVGILPTV